MLILKPATLKLVSFSMLDDVTIDVVDFVKQSPRSSRIKFYNTCPKTVMVVCNLPIVDSNQNKYLLYKSTREWVLYTEFDGLSLTLHVFSFFHHLERK